MRRSRHIEWLSLIEVSGPFLAVSLLDKAFPQGLEKVETPRRQKLRAAYDEWCEARDEDDPELPALHREWLHLVLQDMLEYDQEVLVDNTAAETTVSYRSSEHGVSFVPDLLVKSDGDDKPQLLISVQTPGTDFEKVKTKDGWPVSLMERMVLLCRSTGIRLGLLTNGERWMLVNAPVGATSSHASWYARLWFQEPLTLKAFQSLLGVRRFFGPEDETLECLLEKSLEHQEEVTDTLGQQVRRAVEVLVQCLDKADQDRNRELLRDVSPAELYEAGLTVMMRLVFILCAEERGLLLLGDTVYDECYAVSTLRGLLEEDADRHGPEVLERRHDAWARLLAIFRAVFGGIEHEALRLPAMGGSLFDPDRFPFLEGRLKGTTWRDIPAAPLPIDNRTVLLLLEALQILEQPGGALLLSYRALDVEQIGHVYEGLLEHTVARVPSVTLGLVGSKKAKNPNVPLADLESAMLDGEDTLVPLVQEVTQRSLSAIRNALKVDIDDALYGRLLLVCGGDEALANRIEPFANLLRTDAWEEPIVYRAHSFMVTLGPDRRESGTHYTPKSLTETIVANTLEPLAYVGPSEGRPRDEWQLKSSGELLDLRVCDPTMGSGAFLVQACRWLSERVVQAWGKEQSEGKALTADGEVLDTLSESEPMAESLEERIVLARRLVAESCLYGVDVNPLAVELAKLSIWLVTLAKGRPFGFLDHNLRCGDSLLGLHDLRQLTEFALQPEKIEAVSLFSSTIQSTVSDAVALRKQLRSTAIRDIRDIQRMETLDRRSRRILERIQLIADAMIGIALKTAGDEKRSAAALEDLAIWAGEYVRTEDDSNEKTVAWDKAPLSINASHARSAVKPFHWVLEFPEVFESQGFNAIVGNPPFLGGKKITGALGEEYRETVVGLLANGEKGAADLVTYFFLRADQLAGPACCLGLISTDSITDGDSNRVGPQKIGANGNTIFHAQSSLPWPGAYGGNISIYHWTKVEWKGRRLLDGRDIDHIPWNLNDSISLDAIGKINSKLCDFFAGTYINGEGFILSPTEAAKLTSRSAKSMDIIKTYLTGDSLTTNVNSRPDKYVVDFGLMSQEEASEYVDCFTLVTDRVKPYRDSLTKQIHEKDYWKFWDKRTESYKRIKGFERVLVAPRASKDAVFTWVSNGHVFSDQVVIFITQDDGVFAVLESLVHNLWAWQVCTGKYGSGIRYAPSKAVATFPPPSQTESLEGIGKEYFEQRSAFCFNNALSLNDYYDVFNDPYSEGEIAKLRACKTDLNGRVLEAYAWNDMAPEFGFYETKQGVRFTANEKARRGILQRLLTMNRQRCADEVAEGRRFRKEAQSAASVTGKKAPASDRELMGLFDTESPSSEGSS